MATHYGTAILPARVRKPRDKAKVEVAVQVVRRWVPARLRRRRFHSLAKLAGSIRELITDLNNRPIRHLGNSRRALFEAIERPPCCPFRIRCMPTRSGAAAREWRRCRAGLDYQVEVHGHFYSVTYRLVREVIEARITDQTIELFHKGDRVACLVRKPSVQLAVVASVPNGNKGASAHRSCQAWQKGDRQPTGRRKRHRLRMK